MAHLSELRRLGLAQNRFNALPAWIGELKNLQSLYISENQLTELPKEIGQLLNLEILYLDGNKIDSLPLGFSELRNLKEITLSVENVHLKSDALPSAWALNLPLQIIGPLTTLPKLESVEINGVKIGSAQWQAIKIELQQIKK